METVHVQLMETVTCGLRRQTLMNWSLANVGIKLTYRLSGTWHERASENSYKCVMRLYMH
jgi:hypothetical protein